MAGKGAPLPLRLTLRAHSRYHEDRRFIFFDFPLVFLYGLCYIMRMKNSKHRKVDGDDTLLAALPEFDSLIFKKMLFAQWRYG